ncbi:wax ester/triacylglycerol synthase domain-containing protein [Thermopolyspora sp. NPDC052614]|uniref:wax ester/triacylglycerol synthase domain-containing protein n=1 Tax=Thermopolyspora sp. NPDC052614 TaxID=3155682 RepID=UPI00343DDA1D
MSGHVIERASAGDLTHLANDAGRLPMQVGAVILLEAAESFTVERAQRLMAARVGRAPRLRQRLVGTPPGCGRPIWVPDPAFDVRRHVRVVKCPGPGDEQALLDLVARLVTEPLPRSRPLWRATPCRSRCRSRAVRRTIRRPPPTGPAITSAPWRCCCRCTAPPSRDCGASPPSPAPARPGPADPPGTVLGLMLRVMRATGVLPWLMDHQRLTNTFLTNMRGPAERLSFCGTPIREIIPLPSTTGNVTVVFAALSYAGVLTVTILADVDGCPDLPLLAAALRTELDALTAPRTPEPRTPAPGTPAPRTPAAPARDDG